MPDMSAPIKLGADIWNQFTDWPAFKATHLRAEELGYESLWTMDHIYPPNKPADGPIFEAFTAMSAIAEVTSRSSISVMVASNTYRNPAMLTKIDHHHRPHQRRSRHPRCRRRLGRARARGLRLRVRDERG